MRRSVLFLASVFLAFACSDRPTPAAPAAFDRPESLAFFCWSFEANAAVPLSECSPDPEADPDEDPVEPRPGFALHALLTQTSTGEVAAIRLSGEMGRGVIDSDVRVPGFTFVSVGEVPAGLAVSARDPKHVFVISRGSSAIHVIEVADFRKGTGAAPVAFDDLLPGVARPSGMVLSPAQDALIITLPGLGQLARIPIVGDGQLGEPAFFDLTAVSPEPIDLTAFEEDPLGPRYRYTCPADWVQLEPPVIPPREPAALSADPKPWAIVYDEVTRRLLVSDRSLPIVHVVDPETMLEDAPIAVSAPTRALALTPYLPAEVGTTEPTERYLYAIDEIEQSVMAVELSDPARPTYGAVLPVSVTEPFDRLPLRGDLARALEVVTPSYDANDPNGAEPMDWMCTAGGDEATSGGASLHGVFLAVGTLDGAIRFFDVHDLDIPCRGSTCATMNASSSDQRVAIGRHRPRIGATLALDDRPRITPEPSWTTAGTSALTVDRDGTTSSPARVPTLQPIECEPPLAAAFPAEGDARICAVTDPWSARPERFSITYEGTIPRTAATGGNFDGDGRIESRSDFCRLGVIGSEDVLADGYHAGYQGDLLAITGDLPPSILMSEDEALVDFCEQLTDRGVTGDTTPIQIQIARAFSHPADARETYAGRLVLGEVLEPDGVSLSEVRRCFPELLEFEIRAREAFVVESSGRDFLHPIVRSEEGACVVDPERVFRHQLGRAFFERTYQAPRLRFQLGPRPSSLLRPVLQIAVDDTPTPLFIDVGSLRNNPPSLLTNLVYNDVDERLYAVDQTTQGLMRIQLNPSLGIAQSFR